MSCKHCRKKIKENKPIEILNDMDELDNRMYINRGVYWIQEAFEELHINGNYCINCGAKLKKK